MPETKPINEIYSYNEAALMLASQFGRPVQFEYTGGEKRHLRPEVVSLSGGNYIVTGYDIHRADHRAFRVDRITGTVTVS